MLSTKVPAAPFDNHLLAALPREEYARLAPHLELVRLPAGRVLCEVGSVISHVHFLKGGMASLLSLTEDGHSVEVGMIGNEGVVGLPAVLGLGAAPYRVVMQLPGNALRLRADVLRAEFNRKGRLQQLLLHYLHTLLTQVSQSAACNRYHTMKARLCRWLLVSRDRSHSDTLHLTQEFLAQMMGAPRPRVTLVAGDLQRAGLIRYSRGKIFILDRRGLEAMSCECYRIVREQIGHFLAA
ncbi:MAG TPA: Crp/Fnr family transcriptional regulator [Pyrinomonadaceae bacterium]